MNRMPIRKPLFILAALIAVPLALADERVVEIQTALSENGYFAGEIDGVWRARTSVAIARYQIRNGLEITGKLNPETRKSLGLKRANASAADKLPSGTWEALREEDEEFLESAPPPSYPAAETTGLQTPTSASEKLASPEPGPDRQGRRQERVRDYIAAFVLAGLENSIEPELGFFAERVEYFGEGEVGIEHIRRSLARYNDRFPDRRFRLIGEPEIIEKSGSVLLVEFPLRYDVRGADGRRSGEVLKTVEIRPAGRTFEIVGVDERSL